MKLAAILLVSLYCVALPCDGRVDVTTFTIRLHVVSAQDDPATSIAVSRLTEYAGAPVQVVYAPARQQEPTTAGLTIMLGVAADAPELQEQWKEHAAAKPDSYIVQSVSTDPPVVVASGIDARGTLYAAYHLADLLRAGTDLRALKRFYQPRIAQRYVSFGATTHGRDRYRPELHWKTLNELPGFGYNGIIIYPGGGTPIGRRSSPVPEADDGSLYLDAENTRRWTAWMEEIRKYRLEIMMTIPPVVPPGYTPQAIREYYAGGAEPEGYIPALQSHFRRYVKLLNQAYPGMDMVMFNSTEGATFGRNQRFFTRPDLKRFTAETYGSRRKPDSLARGNLRGAGGYYATARRGPIAQSGQSGRLITGWSKVQILVGPPPPSIS
jgi:hypothetical protein